MNAINALDKSERPSVFLSSSAIGFYGSSETASFDEASPAGRDFLADVCVKWEDAARKVMGSDASARSPRDGTARPI